MAGKTGRRNGGLWWFFGILGLILALIGFRFASSSGWWTDTFGGDRRTVQTVNTGANVFMPTPASPSPSPSVSASPSSSVPPSALTSPSTEGSPGTSTDPSASSPTNSPAKSRLW